MKEMLRSLASIPETWWAVCNGTSFDTTTVVCSRTVKHLETMAPKISRSDYSAIEKLLQEGTIFPGATLEDRNTVLHNLSRISTPIPTVHTFFEDLKYMEPCAKILRALMPPRSKRSIFLTLAASYTHPSAYPIEHSSSTSELRQASRRSDDLAIAYQQLWLFALRNFPTMTDTVPRKETAKEKPLVVEPNPVLWQRFGALAVSLGFHTQAARRLAAKDGLHQLAEQLLERAQCSAHDQAASSAIANILRNVSLDRQTAQGSPLFVSAQALTRERRCGRPYMEDQDLDKDYLFIPWIYHDSSDKQGELTTFFCKHAMFRRFHCLKNVSITLVLTIMAD